MNTKPVRVRPVEYKRRPVIVKTGASGIPTTADLTPSVPFVECIRSVIPGWTDTA